jgi:hypothetical protein
MSRWRWAWTTKSAVIGWFYGWLSKGVAQPPSASSPAISVARRSVVMGRDSAHSATLWPETLIWPHAARQPP